MKNKGRRLGFVRGLIGMRSKSKLEGFLDLCNTENLEGWAWDKDKPNTPIEVDIYDSDTFLARIPANIFRQDLLDAGKGNGRHCFTYVIPSNLKDQKPLFRVKFAETNVELTNSPMPLIIMIQDSSKSKLEGFLDVYNTENLEGWAWDKDKPNTPIEVDIYDSDTFLARIPANIFRQDLLDAGKGNGRHGFIFTIPYSLRDGNTHIIQGKIAGTNVELNNSPMSVTINVKYI